VIFFKKGEYPITWKSVNGGQAAFQHCFVLS